MYRKINRVSGVNLLSTMNVKDIIKLCLLLFLFHSKLIFLNMSMYIMKTLAYITYDIIIDLEF